MRTNDTPSSAGVATTESASHRRAFIRPDVVPALGVLAATAALIIGMKLVNPSFGSFDQLTAILVTAIFLVVASFGQGLVILIGGIDLSIGIVMGVGGMMIANLTRGSNDALIYALPVALVCCTAIGALNGIGIALAGVLVAARRAARVRPLEALRETGAAARVMTASRWILGLFFLAGGVAMLLLVPMVESDGAVAMAIFVSAVLVTGFAALAPLAVPLISWLPRLLARGHLGQLAHANLRSGVRRSASTAAPIMVLVIVIAVPSF